jgi:hypothetical protein
MRYFRMTMGTKDYLFTLTDHGGNATPVWILVANLIFSPTTASDATLVAGAMIDPLLLFAMFVAIARTFGLRTMLICLTVFGTTDFYMFGSNLVGSTMRYDWMAALGLGACALRKERWALGGGLLAYAGLTRAFPALAVLFLVAPAAWRAFDDWRAQKSSLSWSALVHREAPLAKSLLGAAVVVVVLGLATSLAFSFFGTWDAWLHKVAVLSKDAHLNHVGWRTIVAFDPDMTLASLQALPQPLDWQAVQRATLASRRWVYLAGIVAFAVLALMACRGKRLEQAAMAGLFLVPVVFYPANYYCHFICLLPLFAAGGAGFADRRDFAWASFMALDICFLQYFTIADGKSDVAFFSQSVLLLAALLAILFPHALRAYEQAFKRAPASTAVGDT